MERISSETHTYEIGKTLGNGSFGTVFEAICLETGEHVAIKKVFQDSRYKNRELSVMKQLYHPNIICLKDFFFTETPALKSDVMQRYLSLVMQYMPQNLYSMLRNNHKPNNNGGLMFEYVQVYSYQIIRALGYLHSLGLCHRDIKPQNVLLDTKTHIVKLCDFGSAKRLHPKETSVSYICSRFYRAPELMFGSNTYTCSIDIWSIGCVISEMLLGKPLFAGSTSVDQLVQIIHALGAPSVGEIAQMNKKYANFKFPPYPAKPLNKIIPSNGEFPDSVYDLLGRMLKFVPEERILPYEALAMPVFNKLREENYKLPDNVPLPPLFNFSEHELAQMTGELRNKLIPSWLVNKFKKKKNSKAN